MGALISLSSDTPWRRFKAQIPVIIAGLLPLLAFINFDPSEANTAYNIWLVTYLGKGAIYLLWLTLIVAPFRDAFYAFWLVKYRRTFGILAFFYATLHLALWYWVYDFIETDLLIGYIDENLWQLSLGILAWLMLIPLVLTSNQFSRRVLGYGWRILHSLVYIVLLAVLGHYLIIQLEGHRFIEAGIMSCISLFILIHRIKRYFKDNHNVVKYYRSY